MGRHGRDGRQRHAARTLSPLAPNSAPICGRPRGAERLAHQVERLERQVLQQDRITGPPVRQGPSAAGALGLRKRVVARPAGSRLARIYHEQDLLVAECAERGILDGLRPAEMAGLVSVFTYEARGPLAGEVGGARLPGRLLENDGAPSRRWPVSWPATRQLSASG